MPSGVYPRMLNLLRSTRGQMILAYIYKKYQNPTPVLFLYSFSSIIPFPQAGIPLKANRLSFTCLITIISAFILLFVLIDGTIPCLRPAGNRDVANLGNPSQPQWARDMVRRNLELYSGPETNVIPLDLKRAYYTSTVYARATADMDIIKKVAELMTSKDIEKDWNNWVKQKLQEIQPALDDLNKNLK